PLAVLPSKLPVSMPVVSADYRSADINWLGLSHALAYLPAVRALETRRTPRLASRASKSFVGIANPILGSASTATRQLDFGAIFKRRALADVGLLRLLPPLPETETEVRSVARLLRAREDDLFLGKRAN